MKPMTIQHETIILFIERHLVVALLVLLLDLVLVAIISVGNLTFIVVLLLFIVVEMFLLLEGSWWLEGTVLWVLIVVLALVAGLAHGHVVLLADYRLV